jgi:serine/threonine protein kinase
MEYVEGRSLADVVRENPLSAKKSAEYVRSIAEAIQYAHERGTLHRDL